MLVPKYVQIDFLSPSPTSTLETLLQFTDYVLAHLSLEQPHEQYSCNHL